MNARRTLAALLMSAAWLAGCGDNNKDNTPPKEAAVAQAAKAAWHDWQTVELSNGLVSMHLVPQLGGRAMGYAIGGRDLLYANPSRLGHVPGEAVVDHGPAAPAAKAAPDAAPAAPATPPAAKPAVVSQSGGVKLAADTTPPPTPPTPPGKEQPAAAQEPEDSPLRYLPTTVAKDYVNYGGDVVWPVPQSLWTKGWPPPTALDQGTWGVKIDTEKGDQAVVTLTSPTDDELGLQLGRTVTLYRSSTVVRSSATLKNTGQTKRLWALQDLSQHPGSVTEGESFSKTLQAYQPLGGGKAYKMGFAALLGNLAGPEFKPTERLLTVSYLGTETLVGSDTTAGWQVYADSGHNLVLARFTTPDPQAHYPDGGVSATVYTAPSKLASYIGLSLRSGLASLDPNATLSFDVCYAAATCPAPIVSATPVGVVSTPLTAESTGHTVTFSGIFGVFYYGTVQLVLRDKSGAELARTAPLSATPNEVLRLDTASDLPAGAVSVGLVVLSRDRVQVGELANCAIAEAKAKPAEELAAKAKPADTSNQPSASATDQTGGQPAAAPPTAPMAQSSEVPAQTPPVTPAQPEPQPTAPTR